MAPPDTSFTPLDVLSSPAPSPAAPLRWGISGAGRVCHDFTHALKLCPAAASLVAVGCRDPARSRAFADRFGIPHAVESYFAVCDVPEVEIVYVAMLQPSHYAVARRALERGKHVLVEKPMTITAEQAASLAALAKEKGLFMMEGMWTRFFPAVEKARQIIASGDLGAIKHVAADFGFNAMDEVDAGDPAKHPLFSRELGGGGAYYVAPYVFSACTLAFGARMPETLHAVGELHSSEGSDLGAAVALSFGGGGSAVVSYNMTCETAEETTIVGTKGRLRILNPAHCPEKMTVTRKVGGRGEVVTETLEFPLPEEPEWLKKAGGFHYPNSIGFTYEVEGVWRCIRRGWTECPQYTIDEAVLNMRMIEEVRKQIGAKELDSKYLSLDQ